MPPRGDGAVERLALGEVGEHAGDLGDHRLEQLAGVTWRPPWRSLRLTTPTGSDIQVRMRSDMRRRRPSLLPARSIQTSSDEPPPMSKRMTPEALDRPARRSRRPPAAPRSRARRSRGRVRSPRGRGRRSRRHSRPCGRPRWRSGGRARRAVGELGAADLQRLDGADHRRLAEAAGPADPLAEAHDAREGIDDAKAVVARRRR